MAESITGAYLKRRMRRGLKSTSLCGEAAQFTTSQYRWRSTWSVHAAPLSSGVRTPLTEDQILAWADAHYARCGSYPTRNSGEVVDGPGELSEPG